MEDYNTVAINRCAATQRKPVNCLIDIQDVSYGRHINVLRHFTHWLHGHMCISTTFLAFSAKIVHTSQLYRPYLTQNYAAPWAQFVRVYTPRTDHGLIKGLWTPTRLAAHPPRAASVADRRPLGNTRNSDALVNNWPVLAPSHFRWEREFF